MSGANKNLIFVGGKGGVGRSSVSAALALKSAAAGETVLAVDATAAGGLASALAWQRPVVSGEISKDENSGLHFLELDTASALVEYVRLQVNVPLPVAIGPVAKIFDFVAMAAPGVREILTVGKIAHEVRSAKWDLVVVDAPATGHIVEILAAPTALRSVASLGPIASETQWIDEILAAPTSAVLLVLQPEDLPVTETLELLERLQNETSTNVLGLLANRCPPRLSEQAVGEAAKLRENAGERAALGLRDADSVLADISEFLVSDSDEATRQLQRLPTSYPILTVAELAEPVSELQQLLKEWSGAL